MKVKELKEFLNKIDDNFDVRILASKLIPEERLKNMSYQFPYDFSTHNIEIGDIGYSSKIVNLNIDLDKNID